MKGSLTLPGVAVTEVLPENRILPGRGLELSGQGVISSMIKQI